MKWYNKAALALAAIVILPAAASAQAMQPGKWTGVVTPPDGAVNVTYDVTVKGDTIGITVNAGEHGSYKFEDVKLAAGKLTFWFQPGPRVACALDKKEDGSFAGNCSADDGVQVPMTMVPPKKEGSLFL